VTSYATTGRGSNSLRRPPANARERLVAAYRRTGADLPYGDPLPAHGSPMEGWFWRLTDASSGRVVVALCSVNEHPDGDWATVAVGMHPGGVLRVGAFDVVTARRDIFALNARTTSGDAVAASVDALRIDLDDVHLDLRFADSFRWPKAFAGAGLVSSIPFLSQYWHPHRLGGTATGTVEFDGGRWSFDAATLYAEKNWGPGFPERWWWGQAHDFGTADVSVVFTGGLLQLGPIRTDAALVVVRLGDQVIRVAPPARVQCQTGDGRWRVHAKSLRYQIDLEGDAPGREPHMLPVPILAERRNIGAAVEHLAGRLRCTVRERGRVVFDGTSELAGLEVGSLPEHSRTGGSGK